MIRNERKQMMMASLTFHSGVKCVWGREQQKKNSVTSTRDEVWSSGD
jgi:hypothetical protein